MRIEQPRRELPFRLRVGGVVMGLKYIARRRRWPRSWVVPDIFKTMAFRPERFGGPFLAAGQAVMRGESSEWSVGERELFAAFVSAENQCPF